jgi:hypothetical protein
MTKKIMLSNEEAARRLIVGAVHLESIPKEHWEHWNMGSWYNWEWKYNAGYFEEDPPKSAQDLLKCGTTACAGGWLTYVPEFISLGLQRESYHPKYKNHNGMEALEQFFGLSEEQADGLFEPQSNERATPLTVAKKMRRLAYLLLITGE